MTDYYRKESMGDKVCPSCGSDEPTAMHDVLGCVARRVRPLTDGIGRGTMDGETIACAGAITSTGPEASPDTEEGWGITWV
jgi:hypothetical protein